MHTNNNETPVCTEHSQYSVYSMNKTLHSHTTLCGILTYGGVVDVVVGGDHAQIERRHVHLILHTDTL